MQHLKRFALQIAKLKKKSLITQKRFTGSIQAQSICLYGVCLGRMDQKSTIKEDYTFSKQNFFGPIQRAFIADIQRTVIHLSLLLAVLRANRQN